MSKFTQGRVPPDPPKKGILDQTSHLRIFTFPKVVNTGHVASKHYLSPSVIVCADKQHYCDDIQCIQFNVVVTCLEVCMK